MKTDIEQMQRNYAAILENLKSLERYKQHHLFTDEQFKLIEASIERMKAYEISLRHKLLLETLRINICLGNRL